jgi:hypothetical protein
MITPRQLDVPARAHLVILRSDPWPPTTAN